MSQHELTRWGKIFRAFAPCWNLIDMTTSYEKPSCCERLSDNCCACGACDIDNSRRACYTKLGGSSGALMREVAGSLVVSLGAYGKVCSGICPLCVDA